MMEETCRKLEALGNKVAMKSKADEIVIEDEDVEFEGEVGSDLEEVVRQWYLRGILAPWWETIM